MIAYLTKDEVCEWLKIELKLLNRFIKYENFPAIKMSERKTLFDPVQVQAWLDQRALHHIELKGAA